MKIKAPSTMKIFRTITVVLFIILITVFIWGKIYNATEPAIMKAARISDTIRIKNHLSFLTKECRFRNYKNQLALNKAADYIKSVFSNIPLSATEQKFIYNNIEYRNIICSIGPEKAERIVIGAHYDVCDGQEGADDNASGVAGMLELARLLKDVPLKYRIDFVAYTLEEPPFFKTKFMGSYVHAKSLFDDKVAVKGMICLEMIGYYSDDEGSQNYPAFFLNWFYGNKGNFITIVRKYGDGDFSKSIGRLMKKKPVIPTKTFAGPDWLAGVGFSDHYNYWKFGYNAVMITNTAFYRNLNYHTAGDTLETLSFGKIGLVVDEVFTTIKSLE